MNKQIGMVGIGGAPSRATTFPEDSKGRKQYPVASGVLDYFPDALVAVSQISWRGNEQHHAGKPLHWDRSQSTDEADCLLRHFLQRGTLDSDGMRHSAKMVWRALALLQKEIEAEQKTVMGIPGCDYRSEESQAKRHVEQAKRQEEFNRFMRDNCAELLTKNKAENEFKKVAPPIPKCACDVCVPVTHDANAD